MKKSILTVVMTSLSIWSYSQTVTCEGVTFEIFDYEAPTYEWYKIEGSDAFYMDGSYPQMKEMVRKIVGEKISNPTKSFYITDEVHHSEWNTVVNGLTVEVAITKNLDETTVFVFFPNDDAKPEDIIKK